MSVLYSEKIRMCPEVELVSGSPSSPEVEMMLERFIHSYGSSYSSPSMFMKEEEVSASSDQEHQNQNQNQNQNQQAQAVLSGFCGVGSDDIGNGGLVNSNLNSNLIRQSSSPPDFFSHLPMENRLAAMRGSGRVDTQLNFSSGSPTSSRHLPRIAENGNDSWDNSSFNGLNQDHNDVKVFSSSIASEIQENMDFGNFGSRGSLTHHLSLPKNFGMPNTTEKFLHFQNSVPCKMRAKRGFATHPRSIAERMRRTRISERMRRLEDLFPNIDKQTSIADKLELAVEFIKDLQKQVKTLTDTKANCSCSSKQKQHSNPSA